MVRQLALNPDPADGELRPVREHACDRGMKLATPARQQIAVHGFADQRMSERVCPGPGSLDEHLVGERLAQSRLELFVGGANDRA